MAKVQEKPEAWVGFASADLPHIAAADAWSLISDFFNIHKYLPVMGECHKVEDAGEGVSVRYCLGRPGKDGKPLYWSKEKLIEKNESARSILYDVTDNSMGYARYRGGMKIVPAAGAANEDGCKIEWSYDTDPIEGWTEEVFLGHLKSELDEMAKRIVEVAAKA